MKIIFQLHPEQRFRCKVPYCERYVPGYREVHLCDGHWRLIPLRYRQLFSGAQKRFDVHTTVINLKKLNRLCPKLVRIACRKALP